MPNTRHIGATLTESLWRCLRLPSRTANVPLYGQQLANTLILPAYGSKCSHNPSALPARTRHSRKKLSIRVKSIHRLCLPKAKPNLAADNDAEALFALPLETHTTGNLHDILENYESGKDETFRYIYRVVEHLITVRKEEPSSLHYIALIRANASASQGSADVVRDLISEMDELGVVKDSRVYHAALLALAVHPDYVLRMKIIDEMKKLWFELNSDGWHYLIVGLIRDRQYELAMEKLEKMLENKIPAKVWLLDIFMYQLCESQEYDEAFAMLKYRWDNVRADIHSEVWHFLLDSFGKGMHYEGLKFIWYYQVRPSYLIPSDGMLFAVLNTAARYSDPELATSAASILSTRSAVEPYHYEALMEAYVNSNDLSFAFRLLTTMEKAGLKPNATNTRPIFARLSSDPHLTPGRAWQALIDLHKDGCMITLTAINVVIEACIFRKEINLAMLLYKKIHTISDGPNTATFNYLLQGLSRTSISHKKLAMFLASEMRSLNIQPDELTYDRLILICINEKDYEDSFRYLEEMVLEGKGKNEGKGWWMRPGTAQRCVIITLTEGDMRGWDILAEMERRGMNVTKLREWAKNITMAKGNKKFGDNYIR
ncbi:Bgt-1517 [Blumeria graminis f. sp. tritici]|uniref:Bgt-1517 n=2 Tax=Blumeria graminis f. sp. tritici TaxID=62690 RepID=A0A381L3F8_BLUGR|nr:hypothetical protein BGT96224_1517 [Blumeria graminis f. sp. tritici 96224]VCU40080.1 Bgt-1517 [Blumeria graminis f. sp. tritici]